MKYQILKNDKLDFLHPVTKQQIRVFRIIAMKEFEVQGRIVKEHEIGGFIQSEQNLSQDDNSWVFNLGKVFGNSKLEKNAIVTENGAVFDNAVVRHSHIKDWSRVYGNAQIEDSIVGGKSDVLENANIWRSDVFNSVKIKGSAKISESFLHDGAYVSGNSQLKKTILKDTCEINDSILENCQISGRTIIKGQKLFNATRHTDVELNVMSGDL